MLSNFRGLVSRVMATVCVMACMGTAQVSQAAFITARVPQQQTNMTTTMVYILTKGGNFANVTQSVYTYQGHTYCVSEGVTLLIVINGSAGTVCDENGNLIGYTEQVETAIVDAR